jgi:hypothetical protein
MKLLWQHTLIGIGLVTLMSSPQAAFSDSLYSRWQMQRLLQPGQAQLQAEQKGKVFIYQGLRDKEVDRVVHKQFDRLQAMMFVDTIMTDEQGQPKRDPSSGDVMYEDDGC